MFGITLTTQQKLGLAAGGGLLAVVLLAPSFFGGDSEPPAVERQTEKAQIRQAKLERQIQTAEAKGQKQRERFDRVEQSLEEKLQKLRDRSDDIEAERNEAQHRVDAASTAKRSGAAQAALRRRERMLERVNRDIEETEAKIDRVKAGDTRTLVHVRNPENLADARADSEAFHGTPSKVIRLSEAERCAPSEFQTIVGALEELSYRTPEGTKRHHSIYDHEFGDGGILGQSDKRPLLIEDPETHRIGIYRGDARTTFDPQAGILF